MAEEQGAVNEQISDSDRKMDALMDMISDACAKLDGVSRLDARMDALEENFRRQDAARGDEGEDNGEIEAGEPKEVAADEDEAEEAAEAAADEDEDGDPVEAAADEDEAEDTTAQERKDAMADHAPMTRGEAADLRKQIAKLQARAPAIISESDRERFASIQEQADPVFQAFGDRAPAPLSGETPTQYKRRLGSKLQGHSPKWKDSRLSAVSDETLLDTIIADVYADSMAAARRGAEVPAGQLRARERSSGGHTIIEYDGDTESWMNPFAGHSQRGTGNWMRPN